MLSKLLSKEGSLLKRIIVPGLLALLLLCSILVVGKVYGPALVGFLPFKGPNDGMEISATLEFTQASPAPTEKVIAQPPTPVPTAKPAPPPAPIVRRLIWSREYPKVNLRQQPGGDILQQVPNGTPLTIDETREVDGIPWDHVRLNDGERDVEGWVAAGLICSLEGNLPLMLVKGEDGANLRADPQGSILAWLPDGTPVQILETVDVDGINWVHVALPDGRSGWVVQRLLGSMEQ